MTATQIGELKLEGKEFTGECTWNLGGGLPLKSINFSAGRERGAFNVTCNFVTTIPETFKKCFSGSEIRLHKNPICFQSSIIHHDYVHGLRNFILVQYLKDRHDLFILVKFINSLCGSTQKFTPVELLRRVPVELVLSANILADLSEEDKTNLLLHYWNLHKGINIISDRLPILSYPATLDQMYTLLTQINPSEESNEAVQTCNTIKKEIEKIFKPQNLSGMSREELKKLFMEEFIKTDRNQKLVDDCYALLCGYPSQTMGTRDIQGNLITLLALADEMKRMQVLLVTSPTVQIIETKPVVKQQFFFPPANPGPNPAQSSPPPYEADAKPAANAGASLQAPESKQELKPDVELSEEQALALFYEQYRKRIRNWGDVLGKPKTFKELVVLITDKSKPLVTEICKQLGWIGSDNEISPTALPGLYEAAKEQPLAPATFHLK